MKVFRVTKFIPKSDKEEIRIEEVYAASHINEVILAIGLDLSDAAVTIESISEVAPSIRILK